MQHLWFQRGVSLLHHHLQLDRQLLLNQLLSPDTVKHIPNMHATMSVQDPLLHHYRHNPYYKKLIEHEEASFLVTQLKQERPRRSRQIWYWASTPTETWKLGNSWHYCTNTNRPRWRTNGIKTPESTTSGMEICLHTSWHLWFEHIFPWQRNPRIGWSDTSKRYFEIHQQRSSTWYGTMTIPFHWIPQENWKSARTKDNTN